MSLLAAMPPTRQRLETMSFWLNAQAAHAARRRGQHTVLHASLGSLRNLAVLATSDALRDRARREAADLGKEDRG